MKIQKVKKPKIHPMTHSQFSEFELKALFLRLRAALSVAFSAEVDMEPESRNVSRNTLESWNSLLAEANRIAI